MRSATAFLPPCMMTFINLARSTFPYLGSGRISRLGTSRRRGIFKPLNCFSWLVALLHNRESYFQLSLTRPACNTQVWGHYAVTARHAEQHLLIFENYFAFGFFAPYLERDCLRSLTPCKSSEPRTMW